MRTYETGATRSTDNGKLKYEGFLHPLVLKRYAVYMDKHRIQADGKVREPDNWQKGMPLGDYIDSGWRHFMDWWLHHRNEGEDAEAPIEDALCGVIFNAMGYLLEVLKKGSSEPQDAISDRKLEKPEGARDRIGFKVRAPQS